MSEEGVFPALVYLWDGGVSRRLDGFYNTQVVGCRYSKNDLVWPLANPNGEAMYEVDGKDVKRVFHVDMGVPEFALPVEVVRRGVVEWRMATLRRAELPDGKYDRKVIEAEIAKVGAPEARAHYLARVFSKGMKPDTTGQMYRRRWMEGLMVAGEASWPLVAAGTTFGFLQGWQSADTFLPNIGSSPWFGLLLPLALIIVVLVVAIKQG